MVEQLQQYVPVGLLLLVAIGLAVGMMLTPLIFGKPRVHDAVKDSAYECGLPAMTEARTRFSVKFYVIAMLFILFDIEVAFLYPIAVELRAFGGFALAETTVFIVLLFVAFVYVWRRGALEWK